MNAKNLYPDLFPETLLVQVKNGHTIVTSLTLAEHCCRKHKNVLRDIENLILEREKAGLSRLSFEPAEYLDAQKKPRLMYEMDKKACYIFLMGMKGKVATIFREDFFNAFEEQEKQLQRLSNRWMGVVDQISPNLRPVIEATEQNLNRTQIAEMIGKKVSSVSYYRGRGRNMNVLQ